MQELYASGDDLAPLFQGTMWGAYNAATNYANHGLTVRGEYTDKEKTQVSPEGRARRAASTMFGAGAKMNDAALAVATQCVKEGFDFLGA